MATCVKMTPKVHATITPKRCCYDTMGCHSNTERCYSYTGDVMTTLGSFSHKKNTPKFDVTMTPVFTVCVTIEFCQVIQFFISCRDEIAIDTDTS